MTAFLIYVFILLALWAFRLYEYGHDFNFYNDNESWFSKAINRFRFGFGEWMIGDKSADIAVFFIFTIVYFYIVIKF